MAVAAISSVVKVLSELLIKEYQFLKGVDGKLKILKDDLESMKAFLIDATKKPYADARVCNWISQVRELALDAEDTIQMFVNDIEIARKYGFLQRCISLPRCLWDLDTIGEEIDSISERLEAIKRSRDSYGIKNLEEAEPSTQVSTVEWRRGQVDDNPIGLEDDVEKLMRWSSLNEEKRGLSIAVVEGMGGIGKSTLARKIYNHYKVVGGGFERRAWVVVSSEFSLQETIKQLIIEVSCSEDEKKKFRKEIKKLEKSSKVKQYLQEKLQEMLREKLEGKTYFIVLDDIWDVKHWESLKTAFPDQQGQNCRILITTRNNDMVKYGQLVHKMMRLNPKKSWELFLRKTNGQCSQELKNTGEQILEKCYGLPLTITVVGGILMGKHSKSEWEEVLQQIHSVLRSGDGNPSAILELSYRNLSPQLKSCFLCLAFFKEDATIFPKRLINIWVGQGLICQDGRRTTEAIGRSYLDELINRNMVQITELSFDESVKECQLHDLIRVVCLTKAKEEIGFAMVNTTPISTESSSNKVRNCVVNDETSVSSMKHNKHLRSLFLDIHDLRSDEFGNLMKRSPLLQILDIDSTQEMRSLPRCLAKLIGLKYLRVHIDWRYVPYPQQQQTRVFATVYIPRWIDRIKKLEVIDFTSTHVEFPNVELNMESLRYLKGLIVSRIVGIENWNNLETLGDILFDDWMRWSTKLRSNCPLRDLGIELFAGYDTNRNRNFIIFRESLEKMENLVKLHLLLGHLSDPGLYIPCVGSRLTKLKLEGSLMKKCPDASKFPPNLSHLTLKRSDLEEDPMPELGKLPNLSYLKLKHTFGVSKMKVLHDGFPSLKVLTLMEMDRVIGIEIEHGGMSKLKHLLIRSCRNVETQNLPKHVIISTT